MWKKIKDFRTWYREPKHKALIVFPFYFLFFLFIFTMFQFHPEEEIPSEPKEDPKTQTNYAATYQITYTEEADEPIKELTVEEKRVNQVHTFLVMPLQKEYYMEDDLLYEENGESWQETTFSIPFENLTLEKIEKMKDLGEEVYTTEYQSGEKEVQYEIPISSFSKIYKEKEEIPGKVLLTIKEKENVQNVVLDLTEYQQFIIEITYSDYNKIKEEELLE